MPDGCSGDINNNGTNTKCLNNSCFPGVVGTATCKNVDNGGSALSTTTAQSLLGLGGGNSSSGCGSPPRRVQVTAKILFGSVSAITDMKQNEKLKKKSK